MNTLLQIITSGALAAAAVLAPAAASSAQDDGGARPANAANPASTASTARWDPAVVESMATLPVQEGGRIKPLSALAATALHAVHGRRDMKLDTDGDEKPDVTLTPTEWLLDVWCHPEQAIDYPLFRIENVDVLDAIGVAHEGGQRFDFEYITYRQVTTPNDGRTPADTLMALARRYSEIDGIDRSPVESHIVETAESVHLFSALFALPDILRVPFRLQGAELQAIYGDREQVDFATLLTHGLAFADLIRRYRDDVENLALGNAMAIAAVLQDMAEHGGGGTALFPPDGSRDDAEEWLTFGGITEVALIGSPSPELMAMLQRLQAAFGAADSAEQEQRLVEFRDLVVQRARARGEYDRVELEDYYLQASWHYKALHWFLLGILVVAAGWMMPRSRWLWVAGIAATAVPLGFLVTDVVLRCVIRERPPILNLYDTFLFIAAVGVIAALVAEVVSRRRVALSLAPVFGALLITLARAFEVGDGNDQLAPLQAVLDTNYYLATHVTSINMGYAAGMFASFLGTAWLLLGAIGFRARDVAFHKSIVRATYGVTAFGLIFAVFGTIYGGVWANDSWGRFWGWDPKENGALLICIAQVALLHARMCGWVRDLGFCVGAALTGIIVAFSWFHVNLLGIGLHTYGFASSTKNALWTYYAVEGGLTALGAAGVLTRRRLLARAGAAVAGTGHA